MLRPSPIRHPKQNVRVADVRFPKHPAPTVARALGLGARGCFEIVDESPYDTALDQSGAARRDAFVVDGTRRRPARLPGPGGFPGPARGSAALGAVPRAHGKRIIPLAFRGVTHRAKVAQQMLRWPVVFLPGGGGPTRATQSRQKPQKPGYRAGSEPMDAATYPLYRVRCHIDARWNRSEASPRCPV